MCIVAETQYGEALEFVPKNLCDKEMCFMAVRESSEALEFVPNELRDSEMW